MNVYEAIMNRRTIRKFTQEPIPEETLLKLVDCARMAAYGANMQPLKFKIVTQADVLAEIFPKTKWAAMLSNGTPAEGERPTAYIAIVGDTGIKKSFEVDAGAAVTNMMLEAEECGLASCWLGAIDRAAIKQILGLGEKYELVYLLALGYPAQKSRAVAMEEGNIKYFLDDENVVNVPKRSMEEILL